MSAATRLTDALVWGADAIESGRVDIGPLTIGSREAHGEMIRGAFELGRDAGSKVTDTVAPVRHVHAADS